MKSGRIGSFVALAVACGAVVVAEAKPIDLTSARQTAAQFRPGGTGSRRVKFAGGAADPSAVSHVYTQKTAKGDPAVYVFTTGEKGFVMVAADDVATSVLGYSYDSVFDPGQLPDGLKDMLRIYSDEIAVAATSPALAVATADSTPVPYEVVPTEAIDELLTTEWDQLPPYNLLCPFFIEGKTPDGQSNGSRCATGCMTTALAQILFYHRYPARGYGTMSFPVNYTDTEINFYQHTYDWEAMNKRHRRDFQSPNGTYSLSDPSVHAVAQLMFDVGVATRQEFGGFSGGADNRVIPALLAHFNVDPGVNLVTRNFCSSIDEWNRMIIDELRARRPVYMSGLEPARKFGHAFVCDGYDGAGRFHINWGWSGLSNGYFAMTALNPTAQGAGGSNSGYSTSLAMVRGIRPRLTPGEPEPAIVSFDSTQGPGIGLWQDNRGIYFSGRFTVTDRLNVRAHMGLLLIRPDGSKTIVMNADANGAPVQILDKNSYYNFRIDLREEWCRSGTMAYYIYKPVGIDEWSYVRTADGRYCGVLIKSNRMVTSGSDFGYLRVHPGIEIEEKAIPPEFALSFDYRLNAKRLAGTESPRYIGRIGLRSGDEPEQSYPVDPAKVYRNMTETAHFTCTRGATLTPSITMGAGSWMSAYFYIDYGQDGTLSFRPDDRSQEGTDVASYSYWTGNPAVGTGGQDSAGVGKADGNTLAMPSCRAPAEPGRYKIRFKLDWNCIDPAGNDRSGNKIADNGGAIVDATLDVL